MLLEHVFIERVLEWLDTPELMLIEALKYKCNTLLLKAHMLDPLSQDFYGHGLIFRKDEIGWVIRDPGTNKCIQISDA